MKTIFSYFREFIIVVISHIQNYLLIFFLLKRKLSRKFISSAQFNGHVTVIVATRNNYKTIEASIQSLLMQTYLGVVDVIVIDDASDDGTSEILDRLANADARVRVIINTVHRGTGYSRNLGLREAKGEYVTFQDGDDTSHPERIATQVDVLQASPKKILSICSYTRVNEHGQSIWINGRRVKKCIISMMFRREPVLREVGYFIDGSIGEDTDLHERIKITFGAQSIVRIWKVMYYALFQADSSFFRSVTLEHVHLRHVAYDRTKAGERAYQMLTQRHERMRRGELCTYEPFTERHS